METEALGFPPDFLWGAATAAYQVEGSPLADGAGPSNWHRFSHLPGTIAGGDTGDVACDHYRRYQGDVDLMGELGLGAYRFSLAWGRILPLGYGKINRAGLGFYERLIDSLLARGIQPFATLYHWDLPAALDDRGGWLNPDIVDWFADYARVVFRALGDRVGYWATLNEPWVVADAGYLHGVHAPGHRSLFEAPRAAYHLLRSHAAAVQVGRAETKARIGLVVNLEPKEPGSSREDDLAATERADLYMNRQYLDPVFRGRFPDGLESIYGEGWPGYTEADLEPIPQPIDFLGINYYKRGVTVNDDTVLPVRARTERQPGSTYTALDWEVHPESLTKVLLWVKNRYGDLPLYITENGAAFYDPPHSREGRIDDPLRLEYLRTHLRAAREARRLGVNLRGYFAWSLLDNFEWACGFSKRFGIVHVDYQTQERTPKSSALYYREVIRSQGGVLDLS